MIQNPSTFNHFASALLLAACIQTNLFASHDSKRIHNNTIKAAGIIVVAGVPIIIANKASSNPKVKKTCESMGISLHDVAGVFGLSGALMSLSLMSEGDRAQALKNLALRAPLAAGIAGLVFSETFQKYAKQIPYVGEHITCKNEHCKGICHDCKMKKSTVIVAGYGIAELALGEMGKNVNNMPNPSTRPKE